MSVSLTGPFYAAADADGRDRQAAHVTYRVGYSAPQGSAERSLFAAYDDIEEARLAAGPDGRVFEVRGRCAQRDADGRPLLVSVTVLAAR